MAVMFFQTVSTLASLYLPTVNAAIIDDGVTQGNTSLIVRLGLVMLGVTAVQGLCAIGAVYFGSRTGMGFGHDLRAAKPHGHLPVHAAPGRLHLVGLDAVGVKADVLQRPGEVPIPLDGVHRKIQVGVEDEHAPGAKRSAARIPTVSRRRGGSSRFLSPFGSGHTVRP